jgi:cell division septation protein DedD
MKKFVVLKTILLLISFFVLYGCGSSEGDLEGVEKEDIAASPKETAGDVKSVKTDNKSEYRDSGNPEETVIINLEIRDSGSLKTNKTSKTSEKISLSKSYSVQIGAFNEEEYISNFVENAKEILKIKDIDYKKVDGMYKIRIGSFSSLEDAAVVLNKIFDRGFTDTFVVETTDESGK